MKNKTSILIHEFYRIVCGKSGISFNRGIPWSKRYLGSFVNVIYGFC